MRKALFFDLDGTLWNALIPLTESWNVAMKKNGLPYRFDLKAMKSFMGLTPIETVPLAFKDADINTGLNLFKICLKEEIEYLSQHPGDLYPYEEEVIRLLSSKYNLYIVSNADKGYIENYLNACHMGKYFTGHLCAGDTGKDKSFNITYLKNKEKIDDVIYIGDTLKDYNECKKANVKFIHANYGFGQIEEDVIQLNSLLDLENAVEKLFHN